MSLNSIIETKDGSPTLFSKQFNQTYHSINGAHAESMHIFIKNGLEWYLEHNSISENRIISIFEMGFGTGLNCYLSAKYAQENNITISYSTIEKYPINSLHIEKISNKINDSTLFLAMHQCAWKSQIQLNPFFNLKKINEDIMDYIFKTPIDIIFYDAFSPNSQPDLWSESLFEKLYESLNYKGILTTYCAKGQVKRNFKKVGFEVLSLPGPIGKREMTLCIKK